MALPKSLFLQLSVVAILLAPAVASPAQVRCAQVFAAQTNAQGAWGSLLRDPLAKLKKSARKMGLAAIRLLTVDRAGQQLVLTDRQSGQELTMVLGRRLGMGYGGIVYELKTVTSGSDLVLAADGNYILKIPHQIGKHGSRFSYSTDAKNQLELENYNRAVANWQAQGNTDSLPPIVPIVASFETEIGTLLVKPRVHGIDGDQLSTMTRMDASALQSAGKAFDFAQTMAPKLVENEGQSRVGEADMNPSNVVWLSTPEVTRLHDLGLNLPLDKDGFVLYELSIRKINVGKTREQFMADIQRSLSTPPVLPQAVGF